MSVAAEDVVVRDPDPIAATVDGEVVMLSLQAGSYFGLGAVGSEIWELIERPRRVADICAELMQRFDVDADSCRRDVAAFLDDLLARGLARRVEADRPR